MHASGVGCLAVVDDEARSPGDRSDIGAGPSLPAEKVTTTPAASQWSMASHQRLSQATYP